MYNSGLSVGFWVAGSLHSWRHSWASERYLAAEPTFVFLATCEEIHERRSREWNPRLPHFLWFLLATHFYHRWLHQSNKPIKEWAVIRNLKSLLTCGLPRIGLQSLANDLPLLCDIIGGILLIVLAVAEFGWDSLQPTLQNKTPPETFLQFLSVLRVIDRSDRNSPITAR